MSKKVCARCTVVISGDPHSPLIDYGICEQCLLRLLGTERIPVGKVERILTDRDNLDLLEGLK